MATVATQEHLHPEDQTHAHEILPGKRVDGVGGNLGGDCFTKHGTREKPEAEHTEGNLNQKSLM